ncbi:hypothetical protein B5631_001921 [Salmonella enterica subsp. enterica serovar Woodinville]|nr:hypothetical protein [Salmonella enterica]EBS3973265.1 hypothetical protein [Salmonella enterica subsp. enterica serovar Woodinville]VUD26550.1 Uncharacterised protein [Salmonella sp. NCTC 7297]EBL6517859.1 hypothetical protein [Salmonella enterica]ECG8040695.1 hypothetical protein [Salmonella enterica subsp. enterica serovar Woodinville]
MREYESLKLRFVSVTILITETEGWQATRRYKFTNVMPVIDFRKPVSFTAFSNATSCCLSSNYEQTIQDKIDDYDKTEDF